jgi:arylsulfatase A-like enzyme
MMFTDSYGEQSCTAGRSSFITGDMLDLLDDLGIADDTVVMYSTDNGPHMNTWPDGGMTPFRSEKDTNWEGAFRIPLLVRWPGHVPEGVVTNEIVQHHDWLPTFCAIGGDADIPKTLLAGYETDGKQFRVHIDGYTNCRSSRRRARRARGKASCISTTMAISWPSASRSCTTCVPIRTSGPASPRKATGTGTYAKAT